jgi:class 3 adenylate cyclase/tetratricopeptide (TPR) repeat protein
VRFCSNCGQPVNVQTAADSARLTRLAAAAPAPLADKIRAAHLTGERKIVTCLFADVVGSTSLAERMDPDDWAEIMNRAFDQLSPAIYRYEGTIARLMGDAILAFFGAPVAHEDDPVRAVRAALDLIAAARTYADQVRRQHGIEFAIRVGLNTGPVVVGNVGSDLKYEYTAMGDAVNLAARMQSAAKTMTALISEHTYHYVAPVFDCADLGPIEVKGKAEPVRVYEVIAPKATPGRVRGLETAGLESKMIGREAELAALSQASGALQGGEGGGVVAVIGEAGLGKSRLISEWKAASNFQLPTSNLQWAEGHCLSYGQGLAYHLLIDLLRSLVGVAAAADEAATHAELKSRCGELFGEGASGVYPYLAHLLSLPLEGAALERVQSLDPQTLQSSYLEALRRLLLALAARQPLALVLDDVHWADSSSVELLLKLLPLISDQPILFCFITRADREAPGWKLVSAARGLGNALTEINLQPLSESDSRQLVSNLLEVEALPERLRDLILRKAEGNPFFVEEVIRMVMDRGLIVRQPGGWAATAEIESVEIPDNLQGLLLARIDRLMDEAKRALRVASVIGRQFSVRVLEQVAALVQYLGALEASGLIRLAAAQPELEYLFRHALIQEAAYNSLVKQDRRGLHLAVGEALERLYPDRLDDLAPVLGQHFYLAGDEGRALKYLTLAGDAAARVYANAEAALHYARALEISRRLPLGNAETLHLYSSYGSSLELTARYTEALANYKGLEALARTRSDGGMEFVALMAQAKILTTPNPVYAPERGRELLEQALALTQAQGDRAAECKVLWNLMLSHIFSAGDMRRAIEYGERSIVLARELGLREQLAFTLNDIQYAYVGVVEPDRAEASLTEARALWRELGVLPMLADNLANAALLRFERGDFEGALACADEAYGITRSIGNIYGQTNSRFVLSVVYVARGEMDKALENMELTIRLAGQSGHPLADIIGQSDLAWLHGWLGDVERGLDLARTAIAKAEALYPLWRPQPVGVLARLLLRAGDASSAASAIAEGYAGLQPGSIQLFSEVWVRLADGELALARGEFERAIEVMDALLAYLRKARILPYIPEALHLKAQALSALGRTDLAGAAWTQARTEAEALGARRDLWPILWALAEAERAMGNPEAAEALRRQAREIVAFIANHCPPGLRQSFLGLASVRLALE